MFSGSGGGGWWGRGERTEPVEFSCVNRESKNFLLAGEITSEESLSKLRTKKAQIKG